MKLAASVIVPNYNGAQFLQVCLDSLRRQTRNDFEVIVVDDASTDDSRTLVANHYPEVRLVGLPTNRHFTAAVNAGIGVARGEVIVLLNNDTEVEADWLEELLVALDREPGAGMATSKLLLFDRRNVIHSAGDFFRTNGQPGNRGAWEEDRGQFDQATNVFGACGGAAAYRRGMLEAIGLFDEDFVAYCEDVDLSFRAQLAGYHCVFAPRARVYHRLSASVGGASSSFLCGRNFVNVLVKDVPSDIWRRFWARIILAQLALSWRSLRHFQEPAGRAWLFGQIAGLAALPTMFAKRRRVQASRRISPAALESLLEA